MPAEDPSSTHHAISRTEFAWLIVAVVLGSILRLSFPGRIAVEHFDEGVYASNFWFGERDHYSYPARYLYAPPLLPAAIEWTMIAARLLGLGLDSGVPMIPCLAAGIAMIPSLWWVARRWFGPSAGVFSAWLCAVSDFHASYSRTALTDVPVGLFMLWGIYFTGQALLRTGEGKVELRTRRKDAVSTSPYPWREILLAGGFTALAWWTKYNGWLPLAVGATGGILWQITTPAVSRQFNRVLICWTLIALVATLLWMPVVWGLQPYGGYAEVAANHRQYLVGLSGWGHSMMTQVANIGQYDNWFGMFTQSFVTRVQPLAWWATALVAQFLWLRRSRDLQQRIVGCLLLAWFGGMTVATPFYHPYPRLILPWLIAVWLSSGLLIQLLCDQAGGITGSAESALRTAWRPSRLRSLLMVWLVLNCGVRMALGTASAWQDRTGAKVIAAQIQQEIESLTKTHPITDQAIVYVCGEPAIVYSLRARGLDYVGPVANLDFFGQRQPVPTFLVFGKQTFNSPEFREQSRSLERTPFSRRLNASPSHLVEMDQSPGRNLTGDTSSVWLYQTGR